MPKWGKYKYLLSVSGNSYANRDVFVHQLNSTYLYLNVFDDVLSRSLLNGTPGIGFGFEVYSSAIKVYGFSVKGFGEY